MQKEKQKEPKNWILCTERISEFKNKRNCSEFILLLHGDCNILLCHFICDVASVNVTSEGRILNHSPLPSE